MLTQISNIKNMDFALGDEILRVAAIKQLYEFVPEMADLDESNKCTPNTIYAVNEIYCGRLDDDGCVDDFRKVYEVVRGNRVSIFDVDDPQLMEEISLFPHTEEGDKLRSIMRDKPNEARDVYITSYEYKSCGKY